VAKAYRPASTSITRENRVNALAHKLRALATDNVAMGGTDAELAAALKLAIRHGRLKPLDLSEAPNYALFEQLADVLTAWHTRRLWLDDDGDPRPLTAGPRGEFLRLAKQFVPGVSPAKVLEAGLRLKFWRRDRGGRLIPLHRTALLKFPTLMGLEREAIGLSGWLGTKRFNVTPGLSDQDRRLDRFVFSHAIPVTLEREFHQIAREAGARFIETVDDWLNSQPGIRESEPTTYVGAHACAYTEDPTLRAGTRKPRRS
jgi:hypothetical protein